MTPEWESRKNLETSVALFLFEAFIVQLLATIKFSFLDIRESDRLPIFLVVMVTLVGQSWLMSTEPVEQLALEHPDGADTENSGSEKPAKKEKHDYKPRQWVSSKSYRQKAIVKKLLV